jgi:hypothetical protein
MQAFYIIENAGIENNEIEWRIGNFVFE